MSSSDAWLAPPGPRAQPGDAAAKGGSSYTRFIPREELEDRSRIAAWTPRIFQAGGQRTASADFQPLAHPPGSTPSHHRNTPQLPQAQDFSALQRPLPVHDPRDHRAGPGPSQPPPGHAGGPQAAPPTGKQAAAPAGPQATGSHPGHGPQAAPHHGANHGPAAHGTRPAHRDAQSAWREAVREELQEELLAEWQEAAEAELQAQVQDARQSGYQDGYRDGLAALDSFKQSYAQQVTGQVSQLLQSMDTEFNTLEQQMAEAVARIATELARQVVRCELAQHPALVARVAQEAIGGLLHNARQVTVAVHPDDHALIAQACADLLEARGAHLLAQPDIARGGCQVDSDIGSIDARIATRWAQATQTLGQQVPWTADEPAVPEPTAP